MHYNRKDRRSMARKFGLIGSGESQKTADERRARSLEAGQQINRQFLADNEVRLREDMAEKEAAQIASLTQSVGESEAFRIAANNKKLQDDRQKKLAARSAKQKGV